MRIILTGGGTGGHIYPALAMGRHIRNIDPLAEILFVGAKGGLEEEIVPSSGFKLELLEVRGLPRKISWQLVRAFSLLSKAVFNALKIINTYKPDYVIGTGGFAAAPVVIAAIIKKKKVILNEQNVIPGMVNRFLAPWVYKVCLSFEGSARFFLKRSNLVLTGNPRASEVVSYEKSAARKHLNMELGKPLLLVVGGSRGALKLNECMVDFLEKSVEDSWLQVIYITGAVYYEKTLKCLRKSGILEKYSSRLLVKSFHKELPLLMAAADLIVTRAGATTLAEITSLGLPAVIIPSPNVVHNHQLINARELYEKGAAEMIEEKDLNGPRLQKIIYALLNNAEKLKEISENCKKLAHPQAAEKIYGLMFSFKK